MFIVRRRRGTIAHEGTGAARKRHEKQENPAEVGGRGVLMAVSCHKAKGDLTLFLMSSLLSQPPFTIRDQN